MSAITPEATAEQYAAAHERIVSLVVGVDSGTAGKRVPGTPLWSVRDLLAHLAAIPSDIVAGRLTGVPSPEQAQAQVDERRDRSVEELIEEWRSGLEPVVEGARAGLIPAPLAMDAITHEQDLRGALGTAALDDASAVRFAATGFGFGMRARVDGAGLPPLLLHDPDTGLALRSADAEPSVTVTAPAFEVMRLLSGRRSKTQARAMAWSGDPSPYLDHLNIFGPLPDVDIVD